MNSMKLTMRAYHGEDDYWRIRAFLREVALVNGQPPQRNSWCVPRLDYWRWHVVENCESYAWEQNGMCLWETDSGQIAAVINPEGRGEAHFQMHPTFRTPELDCAMLAAAEERLGLIQENGQRCLTAWAYAFDTERAALFMRQGYTKGDWPEYVRWRALDAPIPSVPVAAGYTIRALGNVDELPARSWASWRGFHPDEPAEKYEGWTWYHAIQRMPLYRRDLDIVAAASDGTLAAFCTLWYDDVTRTGYFEPVATVPEHLRRGLGKAVMTEAIRRIQRLGATHVTVGGYSEAANALYSSVVSPDYTLYERWTKLL
jgi:GNAT superfamily N-acetyltransferase